MEITKLLEESKQRQKWFVDQVNALEQQKQQIIQEALKLEGEIRILQRLNGEGEQESTGDSQKQ